jgi:hypothetical protein
MQHLNIDFNKFKVNDSTCAKNVEKFIKPFTYNYKALNCMCFNVLYLLNLNYLHTYLLKLILKYFILYAMWHILNVSHVII